MSKRVKKNDKGPADAAAAAAAAAVSAATAAVAVAPPDPAIEMARTSVEEWAARVEAAARATESSQTALSALNHRNERHQRELQVLRIDAGLLSQLRTEELAAVRLARAAREADDGVNGGAAARGGDAVNDRGSGSRTGTAGPKRASSANKGRRSINGGKGQRTSSTSVPPPAAITVTGGGDNSLTEASEATLDEKKRLKLQHTIMNLFRSNPALTNAETRASLPPHHSERHSLDSGPRGEASGGHTDTLSPLCEPSTSGTEVGGATAAASPNARRRPPAPAAAAGGASPILGTAIAAVGAGGSNTAPVEPRRPREVPVAVWEEVLQLRAMRIVVEERVAATNVAIASELTRFALLQEQVSVARYGLRAAYDAFVKTGGLTEMAAATAAQAASAGGGANGGSRPGSRAASSRGRSSAATAAQASGR